ncbi:hypothetical protein ACFLT4_04400 [Chloroflexota bacterium]
MAKQVGKIEKPAAEYFVSKRKLYLVPLLFAGKEAPAEYVDKFNLYWEQVSEHVANLESKIGKVRYIFHESITLAGDDGLRVMEKLNPPCYQIVMDKCQSGAVLEATEDRGLAEESMDWERCLLMGFMSQKVAKMVSEFYVEALRQRYEHIARRIDEVLKAGEVGMLFVREGHGLQLPQDVEVFSVVPPVLDEIYRWLRDHEAKSQGD